MADGFQIKTWRTGPLTGKLKLPLPAEGLLERGLMRLDTTQHWPRLIFTETGLAALRTMMRDRRLADPVKFAHVRQELGIDRSQRRQARRSCKTSRTGSWQKAGC